MAILQIIISLQTFDILFSLTHGGPGYDTYVLVYTIYEAAFANLSFGEAAAITVLLFFIILICSAVLPLWPSSSAGAPRPARRRSTWRI